MRCRVATPGSNTDTKLCNLCLRLPCIAASGWLRLAVRKGATEVGILPSRLATRLLLIAGPAGSDPVQSAVLDTHTH